MIRLGDEERIVDLLNQNLTENGDLISRLFEDHFHVNEVMDKNHTVELGGVLSAALNRLGFRLMQVWDENGNIKFFKLVNKMDFVEVYKGDGI